MKRRGFVGVLAAALALGALPAAAQQTDPLAFEHGPDRLLVKFEPATDASVIQAIDGQIGAQVSGTYPLDPDLRLILIRPGSDLRAALDYYKAQAEVRYAEPDYIWHIQRTPNDPRFGDQWDMLNTGQGGGLAGFDIDATLAWDVQTDAPGIVVASIDTGVDMNHEDLRDNIWTNPGEIPGNGIDDDGNGFVDDVHGWNFVANNNNPADDNDHGSHTMGTVAAKGDNGVGVAGINWSAQIMPIKVCNSAGSCPTSAIIGGIDYATINHARISSNSYGGGGFDQATYDAISRANDAGVLFSAAAGNNGSNTDVSAFYPAGYSLPNIIAVAAMDRYGGKASYSNYGATTVDLGAPGDQILSTTRNNTYAVFSGTSMACPHVTGAIAFLMGYNPTLNYLDYKQIVMDSAEPNDAMAGRSVTGGTLNLKTALDLTPPLNVPPENEPPVADAGGTYKGRAFRPITFDGSGSYDPNQPGGSGTNLNDFVSIYTWNFGDGTIVSTTSPTVTHTYGAGNTVYTVSLTVKDKYRVVSGNAASTTCTIRGGGKKPH